MGAKLPTCAAAFCPRAIDCQYYANLLPPEITAKTLGDPEKFWKVCDANNAMKPIDLLADPVQTIRIPTPQV
jgi:hypothetical protein